MSVAADLAALLAGQHARVLALFRQVRQADGPARAAALDRAVRLLAIHEAAEQVAFHGTSIREGLDGATLARQRIAEENDAGGVVAHLEGFSVDHVEFPIQLGLLEEGVTHHATEEEEKELPAFLDQAHPEDLGAFVAALERVDRLFADEGPDALVPVGRPFREQHAAALRAFVRP